MSRELWQPNNNGAYSAVRRGANRLTLSARTGGKSLRLIGICAFFEPALLLLGMDCMRCSSRPSRARKIGTGRALARLVAIAFVLVGSHVRRAGAIADADAHSDTHAFADARSRRRR